MQQSTQNSVNSGNLQGSSSLQQSNDSASTYQKTGSLQQDVLGPDAYKAFDGLTVQGAPAAQPLAATTGKSTSGVFIAVFVILVVLAVIVFRRYRRAAPAPVADTQPVQAEVTELASAKVPVKKVVKKQSKKNTAKNKVIKKSKAKAKKKK
jgi:hypothetical protein